MIAAQDPIEAAVLAAVAATGQPYEVIEIDPELADTAAYCERYGYPLEASGNCIVVASKDEPPVLAACVALATTKSDGTDETAPVASCRPASTSTSCARVVIGRRAAW